MKNDAKRRAMRVVLCKGGQPEFPPGVTHETYNVGKLGFNVKGLARTLWFADKGKTWKPAEEKS